MIDKKKAMEAFRLYVSHYDPQNPLILHKVQHSGRVSVLSERIAGSLKSLPADDVSFAWFLGLVHDIGRFEQVRRFNTFIDSVSVDHAELSADILFQEGLIDEFVSEQFPAAERETAEIAVRAHNKLTIPEGLDERKRLFCDILRDADKADIFRLVSEMSFETRAAASKGLFTETEEACPEVMECVLQHRCVPRNILVSRFDGHIAHCCLAFELVYPETRIIVSEQGWLRRLLSPADARGTSLWNERETEQLEIVRREIEKCWGHSV